MNKNISKITKVLIKKYGTNNPFEIAAALNIDINKLPLGNTKGFYKYYKRSKIIFLNDELDDYQLRVVCAHELGHAVLHPRLNIILLEHSTLVVKNKYEIEANKFASELLLPDGIFEQYFGFTFEQIAAAENINKELVKLKFR